MAISVFPRVGSDINRWSSLRKGHWSTVGLVYCMSFGQGAPAIRFPTTRMGSPSATTPTGDALGINFASINASLQLDSTGLVLPTERVTVLLLRQFSDATARNACSFGVANSLTTNRCGAVLPNVASSAFFDFGGTSSPNRISASYTKTTRIEAWACVAGSLGSSIWINGASLVSQSTAITRINEASAGFSLNNGQGNTGDLQTILFFAVLDAEWTAPQITEWTVNPWIMFEKSSPIMIPAIASAAIPRFFPFIR